MARRTPWQHYVSAINVNTPMSKIWTRIRKMRGNYKQYSIPSIEINNQLLSDPKEIANVLAEHFKSTSSATNYCHQFMRQKHEKESIPLNFDTNMDFPYNDPITMREVKGVLQQCKRSAPGDDDITYEMLRQAHESSIHLLLRIYNRIWLERTYPRCWRSAVVLAFLKPNKPPAETTSYRPIALTSCIGKLLEKMVNIRMMHYLEKEELLSPLQYGFRKMRSTTDALLRFSTDVLDTIGRREQLVSVFFDMTKAYDTTRRRGIMNEVDSAGVRGHMAYYIGNFLQNRNFRTRIGTTFSDTRTEEE
jgi:hypothetical protein